MLRPVMRSISHKTIELVYSEYFFPPRLFLRAPLQTRRLSLLLLRKDSRQNCQILVRSTYFPPNRTSVSQTGYDVVSP